MIFFSKQCLMAMVLICEEWPSYRRSLHSSFWPSAVSCSKHSFSHSMPSSLSVQPFSETHILPGNSCLDRTALNFVVHFVCCTLPLKIIQGLNTLAFNEIHSTKVTYSRLLSCVDINRIDNANRIDNFNRIDTEPDCN